LSSALYLKGCQFCSAFFLERGSWSQPYHVFFIAPSLIMPPSIQIGFSLGIRLYGGRFGFLTRNCLPAEFLEFQSYSRHINHFNIDSKQTHFAEIQMIPMERFSEVMKTFCFDFGENVK
jgi:hypothetical protein